MQGWGAGKFFRRLRLRLLVCFFERLRLQGAKKNPAPAPDYWFVELFFSPQTSKVKRQKI